MVAGKLSVWTQAKPVGGLSFDRVMVALYLWLTIGLHLDGWAHIHIAELETFFTPWHAVLYSGFFLISAALVGVLLLNRMRGASWTDAMPRGYGLSLAGVPLFLLGGIGDMTWHVLFGIENGIEALLSPTHLLLALSIVLFFIGPIRAAAQRRREVGVPERWTVVLPMLIALSLMLALFSFFTQYASPFATTWPGGVMPQRWFANTNPAMGGQLTEMAIALGIVSMLLQTALMMGVLLLIVRRWSLPFGSLTVVIALSTLLMTAMRGQALSTGPLPLFGVSLLAGLLVDLLLKLLAPTASRRTFRIFALSTPMLLYSLYFGMLALTIGIWWSIHLWTGAIVLAGVVGLLVSVVILPPPNMTDTNLVSSVEG
jgi:hypothetical protein